MLCQDARWGVDCSRTPIASKRNSYEASNSPWQITACAAGLPRLIPYFNSYTGCLLLSSETLARLVCRTDIKVHEWTTASSANYQKQAPLSVTPQRITERITNLPLTPLYFDSCTGDPKIRKKEKKNWIGPQSKARAQWVARRLFGAEVKHSSYSRRSIRSAITGCQAIWRFCLISDMNNSQFKSRFNHVVWIKKVPLFRLVTMVLVQEWSITDSDLVNISDTNHNAAFCSQE